MEEFWEIESNTTAKRFWVHLKNPSRSRPWWCIQRISHLRC